MSRKVSSVFLNVPFDQAYEPYFVALVAAVVAVGRTPRSVLELPERGTGRLSRLLSLIRDCGVSIHDLSRVGVPVRFNMPFELGLACAAAHGGTGHAYILLERVEHRLDRTLSDIKGRDPYVYGGSPRLLVGCVLDALRKTSVADVDPRDVLYVYDVLRGMSSELKRLYATRSLFTRSVFLELVTYASVLAAGKGLIEYGPSNTRAA